MGRVAHGYTPVCAQYLVFHDHKVEKDNGWLEASGFLRHFWLPVSISPHISNIIKSYRLTNVVQAMQVPIANYAKHNDQMDVQVVFTHNQVVIISIVYPNR